MIPERIMRGGELPEIPGYKITEEIGAGRTATVYRARPRSGQVDVAIKVLHRHLALDSVLRERFRREIDIARELIHPNILPVYDLVSWIESPAAVMEYCPGGSLEDDICRKGEGQAAGPKGGEELLSIARQVASALEAAHRRGIVHRDLKPSNLLRARDGTIKLCDFGSAGISALSGLTRSTISFGSPEFTPPESLFDPYPDPRWDLYSLGAVLYLLGSGRSHSAKFPGTLPAAAEAPEPLRRLNPDISRDLSEAILGLLASIETRTASASEFLAAIGGSAAGGTDMEGRPGRIEGRGDSPGRGTRGTGSSGSARKRKTCLFCGISMPFEAPVCLNCGESDIAFTPNTGPGSEALLLTKLPEDAAAMERFFRIARAITEDPGLTFRFLTEDRRLYSREERKSSVALPAKLLDELDPHAVDRLIPLFKGDLPVPPGLTRKPSGRTKKLRPILKPRICPQIPDDVLAAIERSSAVQYRIINPSDRSIMEKGMLAAGRASLSSRQANISKGDAKSLEAFSALLEAMNARIAEADSIRKGLDSVSLGETYAQIRALERAIAESSDSYETDELIRRKIELEGIIEGYRKGELSHSRLVARIIRLIEELEKAGGKTANSSATLEAVRLEMESEQ